MSQSDASAGQPEPTATIPFLRRWSERKQRAGEDELRPPQPMEPAVTAAPVLTDSDMPPLESLDEKSDYSVFFSSKVSQELRRQALHKLFHSPTFNVGDGLSDYSEDYTRFEPLGNLITQDRRHRLEVEAARLSQSLLAGIEASAVDSASSRSDETTLSASESETAE